MLSHEFETRFWEKVAMLGGGPDECWPWTGARTKEGYGNVKVEGANAYAHRVAYQLVVGEIAEDADVCHTCDNEPCCNPMHLFDGTRSENMLDASSKHRLRQQKSSPLFCKRNHLLMGDNLIVNKKGWRSCKTCQLASAREYDRRRRPRKGNLGQSGLNL